MDRLLCPNTLELDPDSPTASTHWNHWLHRFQNFIRSTTANEEEKHRLLINYISPSIYEYVSECSTYNQSITVLKNIFVKPINEVFARHKLFIRRQQPNETIDRYLEALKLLSRDCQFKAVTAETNRDDCIRDSFIRGLLNPVIRQRLLENVTLSLTDAHSQSRSLESAQLHSMQYEELPPTINAITENFSTDRNPIDTAPNNESESKVGALNSKCYFCGGARHSRDNCPAKDKVCNKCGKIGHYQKVCKSKTNKAKPNSLGSTSVVLCSVSQRSKVKTTITLNGCPLSGMLDSGSDISLIDEAIAQRQNLKIKETNNEVGLASNTHMVKISGTCKVNLEMLGYKYPNTFLSVMPNLCSEIIIGRDLLQLHSSVQFDFGGDKPPLIVSALTAANVEPACLFSNLAPNCKPLAVKSVRHSINDTQFIEAEVEKLLNDGIIEKSNSPWRAQVLVTSSQSHKRRMVIDYSRTINRFTELDAYPIPCLNEIVSKIAKYKVFSTIDLKSAYHQIPIPEKDRPYTAFEAAGELFQFTRIPFGTTNGVAAFQRTINQIVQKEKLKGTFAYLDDITICGHTQDEHDENLKLFMKAASKYNLTINHDKSSFSQRNITLLGHSISDGVIRPDPSRLKPLKDFPPPVDTASLRRALGMFSHYSKFIPKFAEKIKYLTQCSFPLSEEAIVSFHKLKKDIEKASVTCINYDIPFCVETDASETTIAATLCQQNRPVAFFSRTLSDSEKRHSSIEKEAYAIVEAIRHWKQYLMGRHFRLITDQRSVAFMFDIKHGSKIKNEKITRWRLELSCYSYDIVYRPGKENQAADAFSRICSATSATSSMEANLRSLHKSLCHPGISRLYHWIRCKNLPFSMEDVKRITSACSTCAEVKPRFCKHQGTLIKASTPFERLNLDFKGPLPSTSRNKYLLTVVDEYSRFPFVFPCQNTSASTIIKSLQHLFGIFGCPSYIHSDRGSGFMSQELKTWLTTLGVSTSRTTPYNPKGNGQVERYNRTIWKTIQLALKEHNLPITRWEEVISDALHAIRSLLCTSTNCTPHERMFSFPRRSPNGFSTPSWLLKPGTVLLRRFGRQSKFDPTVEKVELLEGNPEYSYIRYPDGRETTVSNRHLAAPGNVDNDDVNDEDDYDLALEERRYSTTTNSSQPLLYQQENTKHNSPDRDLEMSVGRRPRSVTPSPSSSLYSQDQNPSEDNNNKSELTFRRSTRQRKPPTYLKDYCSF